MVMRVNEARISMSMVDGDVLTPQQLQRIVAAVKAELRRDEQDEQSRQRITRLGVTNCGACTDSGDPL